MINQNIIFSSSKTFKIRKKIRKTTTIETIINSISPPKISVNVGGIEFDMIYNDIIAPTIITKQHFGFAFEGCIKLLSRSYKKPTYLGVSFMVSEGCISEFLEDTPAYSFGFKIYIPSATIPFNSCPSFHPNFSRFEQSLHLSEVF